jgi:hypothetical protein
MPAGWLRNSRFWGKNCWSQFGTMLGSHVRIVALSTIKVFLNRSPAYSDAREPVMAWFRQVKGAD